MSGGPRGPTARHVPSTERELDEPVARLDLRADDRAQSAGATAKKSGAPVAGWRRRVPMKLPMKPADRPMVEVCSGKLGASVQNDVHSVSPRQQWQLVVHVDGYEPSQPLLVNHGGSLDGPIFMKKLNDTFELKPLAGSGNRVLRLHIANRLRHGAARELTLYAPYWLVNLTALPLAYREVHLGLNLVNTAHAMEGRTDTSSATMAPAPSMSPRTEDHRPRLPRTACATAGCLPTARRRAGRAARSAHPSRPRRCCRTTSDSRQPSPRDSLVSNESTAEAAARTGSATVGPVRPRRSIDRHGGARARARQPQESPRR